MRLRDMLNELKWRHDDLASIEIVVLHRGAPDDRVRVPGIDIVDIGNKGLFVAADEARSDWESALVDDSERTKFLPWHRILAVHGKEGALWTRKPS